MNNEPETTLTLEETKVNIQCPTQRGVTVHGNATQGTRDTLCWGFLSSSLIGAGQCGHLVWGAPEPQKHIRGSFRGRLKNILGTQGRAAKLASTTGALKVGDYMRIKDVLLCPIQEIGFNPVLPWGSTSFHSSRPVWTNFTRTPKALRILWEDSAYKTEGSSAQGNPCKFFSHMLKHCLTSHSFSEPLCPVASHMTNVPFPWQFTPVSHVCDPASHTCSLGFVLLPRPFVWGLCFK